MKGLGIDSNLFLGIGLSSNRHDMTAYRTTFFEARGGTIPEMMSRKVYVYVVYVVIFVFEASRAARLRHRK